MKNTQTILLLLALLAAPRFATAQSDRAKDADDKVRDAVDTGKDKLGTDSGAKKAGRHADRAVRTVRHKARHTQNAVKEELHDATK